MESLPKGMLEEAEMEQQSLAQLVLCDDDENVHSEYVVGVDVAYHESRAFACAVVLERTTGKVVEVRRLIRECTIPYVSSYFYLREGPIVLELLQSVNHRGIVLIDGNGILHPRRMGLASYIGVKLDMTTIGVAKKLMIGTMGAREGNVAPILYNGECIGAAVWLEKCMNPIYVSIGHRISLETAISIVMQTGGTNLPMPLLKAHECAVDSRNNSMAHR